MDVFSQTNIDFECQNLARNITEIYRHFMITDLFLPFLFFKVFVFHLFTFEDDSTAHDIVGVVHGIFLLDFSFEVCYFSV